MLYAARLINRMAVCPVDQPAVPMLNQGPVDQPAVNKGLVDQLNGRLWMLNRDQAAWWLSRHHDGTWAYELGCYHVNCNCARR